MRKTRIRLLGLVISISLSLLAVPSGAAGPDSASGTAWLTKSAVVAGESIFVTGNNEVAVNLRRKIMDADVKNGSDACFSLMQNPKEAQAILKVSEIAAASGGNGKWTTYGTATLTSANGDFLWADSKQGMMGIIHSGAGDAAGELLDSLYTAAGCTTGGKIKAPRHN